MLINVTVHLLRKSLANLPTYLAALSADLEPSTGNSIFFSSLNIYSDYIANTQVQCTLLITINLWTMMNTLLIYLCIDWVAI